MKKTKFNKSLRSHYNLKGSHMIDITTRNQVFYYSQKGFSMRLIAKTLGISRVTVKKILMAAPKNTQSRSNIFIQEHIDEIKELFFKCKGHCTAVYEQLKEKYSINFTLRTLQRHVKHYRTELKNYKKAIRYETKPGDHLQIDFGQTDINIANISVRIHFFTAVLAYSRRIFVKAYMIENQSTWFDGIESAFGHFEGITRAVICDNSRCLIDYHNGSDLKINSAFKALCHYYRTKPIACTPYLPCSKGKYERAVRYIKDNAFAGRDFSSIEELNNYLRKWMLKSDLRLVNSNIAGKFTPIQRYQEEQHYLMRLECRPRFSFFKQGTRKVSKDGLIRIDNQSYLIDCMPESANAQFVSYGNKIKIFVKNKIITLDKTNDIYKPKLQNMQVQQPKDERLRNRLLADNELSANMSQYYLG